MPGRRGKFVLYGAVALEVTAFALGVADLRFDRAALEASAIILGAAAFFLAVVAGALEVRRMEAREEALGAAMDKVCGHLGVPAERCKVTPIARHRQAG